MDDTEKKIRRLFELAHLPTTVDLVQHCLDRRLTIDDVRYLVLDVAALLDADPGELARRLLLLRDPGVGGVH